MKNIRLAKGHRDVAVRVCGPVLFEVKRGAVEGESLFRGEHFGGNRGERRGREVEIPILDALRRQEMLVGIVMGQDRRPLSVQPAIAVGMIVRPSAALGRGSWAAIP